MTISTVQRFRLANDLIQQVFGKDRDLASEFPLVFDPSFQGSLVGLEVDDSVVSACAILPRDMIFNGWLLKVGMIGSVATEEGHRGKGYAGQLLRQAEKNLFCEGAVISMLWADEAAFYEKKGYIPVGCEVDYALAVTDANKLPSSEGVRWIETRDHAAIHALYVRHSHRADRTLAESSTLMHGPGIAGLVREIDGEVVGYALMGRGHDLQGVVHEWGGDTSHVLSCLRAFLDNMPEEATTIYLMCPVTAVDMRKGLLDLEIPALEGVLAMARVLDMPSMAKVFQRFGDPRLRTAADEESIRLTGPKGSIVLDRRQALLATWPPQANRGVVEIIEKETGI
ncbi:MAG: GNAT family N-acetyltransferase, partial [Planctomycetota bacterium]|nr:GNAT family N-acetyltransferase [Planctomycetota bacterium]